ncbi:beta-N-acetylglucosaminidase [Mycoplasmopsis canis UFG1]|uniref:beta-N-acetylhexosaminidase family protein n=1 Tax=Mycoplasmopsis canis TaxID=29555 RepID=UPI00025B08BF|nr:beta-N-acetylglucosaminidase domain-containing protein [Mycoplasmopsis canis]EIE41251.1 beta-N-acetylglucosaminidase [Mycoplasmopsis canis UFG1]
MNIKKVIKFIASAAISSGLVAFISTNEATSSTETTSRVNHKEYKIYPTVHSIEYFNKRFIITPSINLVLEHGIDEATVSRFEETLKLKNISYQKSRRIVKDKTNILIGLKNNKDTFVDDYISSNSITFSDGIFNKTDSYVLNSQSNVITLYASESDASFYGVTSLWHIFNQLNGTEIEEFKIEDYADIKTRGVIEGYYGNPWTTDDRLSYMKWGSYYKLNGYFYAPKDDPKHIDKWRELYTDEELENKIKPLAIEGNKTKVRYIYTLHPFKSNRLEQNTYDTDLQALKAKFMQVIKVGVRQIGILADDFTKPNQDLQLKLLQDMVAWLKELKNNEYPDMKVTLPYVVHEYAGQGESHFRNFPEEVQIVMTGGKIWGEVSENFTNNFTNNTGRGPLLWINWPCSDNSKNHLIMGGYKEFLHKNVDPEKVQGIIFNPMQQNEPSKVAIFGGAEYSWNIWKTDEHINNVYNDSFKYVANNSLIENDESRALRELSKHMINQHMDSRVVSLQESVELAPKLTTLLNKLNDLSYTEDELNTLRTEFLELHNHAKTLKETSVNRRLFDQMNPWINSAHQLFEGLVKAIDALKELKANNVSDFSDYLADAKELISQARTSNGFVYLNHIEYAEVGVQHIQPFASKILKFMSDKQSETLNPDGVELVTTITSNLGNSTGVPAENALDPFNTSDVIYKRSSNRIQTNDYIQADFNKPINLKDIFIQMAGGTDHFYNARFEYKLEGSADWQQVQGSSEISKPRNDVSPYEVSSLNIENVVAIRLISTSTTNNNNDNGWLRLKNFLVNKGEINIVPTYYSGATISNDDTTLVNAGQSQGNILDNNHSSEWWLKTGHGKDFIDQESTLAIKYNEEKVITKVLIEQGSSRSNDVLRNAEVQYWDKSSSTWKKFGSANIDNSLKQIISGYAVTNKLRIVNKQRVPVWWRLGTFKAGGPQNGLILPNSVRGHNINIATNAAINDRARNNRLRYILDGDDNSLAWMSRNGGQNIQNGDGIDVLFGIPKEINSIRILQDTGDKMSHLKVQKLFNGEVTDLGELSFDGGETEKIFKVPSNAGVMTGIRIISNRNTTTWWKLKSVDITDRETPSSKYLHTTIQENSNLLTLKDEDIFKLWTKDKETETTNYEIPANGYLGIDLKELYKIKSVEALFTATENIKLKASISGYTWIDLDPSNLPEKRNFRYIMLQNTSEQSIFVPFNKLTVITEPKAIFGRLVTSNIPINSSWGDTRYNGSAFDTDLRSQTKFGGNPSANNYAIYDLGTEVDLHSLRIYTSDNTVDFPRNIDVQISNAQDGEYETVFSINDAGSETFNGTLQASGYGQVDSNYPNIKYWGNDNIANKKARYIKLLIKNNYPTRALIINEIVVNRGEYISLETDPRFDGENFVEIDAKSRPENMLDNNFDTSYKPAKSNGNVTLSVDPEEFVGKNLRVISEGESGINTTIKAIVYDTTTSTQKEVSLGVLSNSVTSFNLPKEEGMKIVGFNFSWTDKKPIITEVLGYVEKNNVQVNKEELRTLSSTSPTGFENWIQLSKDKFNKEKATADSVLDSASVTQETVDNAKRALQRAVNEAQVKADKRELEEIVSSALNNEDKSYTDSSFFEYNKALAAIKHELTQTENLTQNKLDELKRNVENAKSSLEYSKLNQQIAELNIAKFEKLIKNNYTEQSYLTLQQKVNEIKQKLSDNSITPTQYADLNKEFNKLFDQLEKTELGALINEYNSFKETKSYPFIDNYGFNWNNLSQPLSEKILELDKIIEAENVTEVQVRTILNQLQETTFKAINDRNEKINSLKTLVEHTRDNEDKLFTEETFEVYASIVNEIKSIINLDDVSPEQIDLLTSKFNEAKEGLKFDETKLNEAKRKAKNSLNSLDDKKDFAEKIENATTVADVSNIIDLIQNEIIKQESSRKIENFKNKLNNLVSRVKNSEAKNVLSNLITSIDNEKDYEDLNERILNEIKNELVQEIEKELLKVKNERKVSLFKKNLKDANSISDLEFLLEKIKQENTKSIETPKNKNNDNKKVSKLGLIMGASISSILIISGIVYTFIFKRNKK